ncbi:MAG: YfhO family protein [Verrucomicrobiota bacterium]
MVFLMGDLLWFGHGRSAQCDPALYYPRISVLDEVAKSVPGRVIGFRCLPASLAMMQGLNDIRGYDAIDPMRMVDLLKLTAKPGGEKPYAATQFLVPKGNAVPPSTVKFSPVLDMLGVRYAIFRGDSFAPFHPLFQGNDYWVLINSNALPRVFVPKSVTTTTSDGEELEALASPQFNPADVAYVESAVALPILCRGTAEITNEIPTRIRISVHMETPGLVVLADNWDKGWRAYWNGKPVPVLRANYAVRGVVVPAGNGTLEFIYKPASLILGLWLAGFAAFVLICRLAIIRIKSPSSASNANIVS